MTTAPAYRKVNPTEQPILYLAMSSPTLPLSKVDDYADTHLAQRISMLSGVAEVQVYGSQKYAVRVRVDPKALISRAIQSGNVNLPTGNLSGAHRAFYHPGLGAVYGCGGLPAPHRRLPEQRPPSTAR
jgi:HAE1 family hydrophobic/amphiphilic exporter-1